MVTDAVFTDFNKDGKTDLIIGEWMKPTFFANTNGKFVDVTKRFSGKSNGLWHYSF
jgi:hypothetical protein